MSGRLLYISPHPKNPLLCPMEGEIHFILFLLSLNPQLFLAEGVSPGIR
jgi:hypothetical protein